MKKILLFVSALIISASLQAQKIEQDEINSFRKRIILTSLEQVNWQSPDHQLEVGLMLEGSEQSMILNWQCHEMVGADRDARVVLLFDDGSETVLLNKKFSVSGTGKVKSENVSATTIGIKIDAKGDLTPLSTKQLNSISVETTSGKISFPVTVEEAAAIAKVYNVFEKQCAKKIKIEEF